MIWELLEDIADPEIPVLSIVDLGIVREVRTMGEKGVEVLITPTYSGCPAMVTIEQAIRAQLKSNGYDPVQITTVISPAWTTDWLSEKGRQKLLQYGIAPPAEHSTSKRSLWGEAPTVECPHCHSTHTEVLSQFGSTACKALYRCMDCREPFDYFKCH